MGTVFHPRHSIGRGCCSPNLMHPLCDGSFLPGCKHATESPVKITATETRPLRRLVLSTPTPFLSVPFRQSSSRELSILCLLPRLPFSPEPIPVRFPSSSLRGNLVRQDIGDRRSVLNSRYLASGTFGHSPFSELFFPLNFQVNKLSSGHLPASLATA